MSTGKTLRFTKMHGAGNDFVVLNNLDGTLDLTPELIKRLGDRHFGVGADQILIVEPARSAGNDFRYRIFNADGHEVQQCGNGARCFAQYIADKGLSDKKCIKVETIPGVIEPQLIAHNWIKVNMGPASFQPTSLPFNPEGLSTRKQGQVTQYCLPVSSPLGQEVWVAVVSMGNPHVVVLLDEFPSDELVNTLGPILESHPRFPQRVNVGFLHITNPENAKLRVYERGVGETLACGTGACAAAVLGIRMGHLHNNVNIHKVGGILTIEWNGAIGTDVFMTGPAQTVFEGEFYL